MRGLLLGFVAALAVSLFAAPASAQLTSPPRITPQPSVIDVAALENLFDVRVGPTAGTMVVRYNPHRSGAVTGTLLGARVEGYYYTAPPTPDGRPARSLALLRYRGTTPVQAITADYDYTARNWIGFAHWLTSGAGEGSATQNALGFRTVSPTPRVCLRSPCTPDTTLPVVATAPAPLVTDPLAGVNVVAGSEAGPLVFRTPNSGVFRGHLWGDAVTGHYASPAGTVVFIRDFNGQPFQIWRGVLGASGGGGRGFPLNASGGAPFNWTAGAQDQIVTGLRSIYDRNSCVHLANASSGAGGFIDVGNCADASRTAWVIFGLGADRFGIASTASGLCLTLSPTRGQHAQQQPCADSAGQGLNFNRRFLDASGNVIGYEHAHNATDIATSTFFHAFGTSRSSMVGTECMGLLVSQGRVVTMNCAEDKAAWTTYR